MKPSFLLPASLVLGLATILGCARPQALMSVPSRQVHVNLDSLLPLHPSYSLLSQPQLGAGPLAWPQGEPPREPLPASAQLGLSYILPPPPAAETWTPLFPTSSILESLTKDRAATLIGLKTVLQSRRRAATDLLEEEFIEQKRQASLPLVRLRKQAIEAQLEEIVALQARLAATDLPPDVRKITQGELASMRNERLASLQAEQRKTALEMEGLWATQRLAIERQLADYDTRVRTGAETAFTSRGEQTRADSRALEQALLSMAAPRPPAAAQQVTVLTTSAGPASGFPTLPVETRSDSLSRIRKEVAAAIQHVAALNSWNVSLVPQADTEDVTEQVRDVLSQYFYPKW